MTTMTIDPDGHEASWRRRRQQRRSEKRSIGWADPDLLPGRSSAGMVAVAILVLIGSVTDTTAFKSSLDLVLRESEAVSWLLAAGVTCLALAAAWSTGRELAGVRRAHQDSSVLLLIASLLIWLALGAALFYVRWHSASSGSAATFGVTYVDGEQVRRAHAAAILFGTLYLASGLAAAAEASRITNPRLAALRLAGRARCQAERTVAERVGEVVRARLVVAHHAGEFDRELDRRAQAQRERQALGVEAANYARVLMASLLADPRKTGLTGIGPTPEQPEPGLRADPEAAA